MKKKSILMKLLPSIKGKIDNGESRYHRWRQRASTMTASDVMSIVKGGDVIDIGKGDDT